MTLWSHDWRAGGMRALWPALGSTVVMVACWLPDLPALTAPGGLQGLLRAAGVLAGAAGGVLWATSLFLMLRLPAWDRWFGGLDRQYFAHHLAGSAAYLLLLVHVALLIGAQWTTSPPAAADLATPWRNSPAVAVGWLGLIVLMVMMFVTFLGKLAYGRWKVIHAASGVAYVLAFAHVAELLPPWNAGRLGAVVLILAMIGGLAAIAVRRIMDRAGLFAQRYLVEQVSRISSNTMACTLVPAPGALPLVIEPSQFVFVSFDAWEGHAACRHVHPFTVTGIDGDRRIRLMVKALGVCTEAMQGLKPGVGVRVQGPHGALFGKTDVSRPQVWIGGGIGITPFMAVAQALPKPGPSVDVYLLFRDAAETPGVDVLREAAQGRPGLRLNVFAGDDNLHRLASALEALSPGLAEREIYLCGPPVMLETSLRMLLASGAQSRNIHIERFDFR